jgi:hypothetical protein
VRLDVGANGNIRIVRELSKAATIFVGEPQALDAVDPQATDPATPPTRV